MPEIYEIKQKDGETLINCKSLNYHSKPGTQLLSQEGSDLQSERKAVNATITVCLTYFSRMAVAYCHCAWVYMSVYFGAEL